MLSCSQPTGVLELSLLYFLEAMCCPFLYWISESLIFSNCFFLLRIKVELVCVLGRLGLTGLKTLLFTFRMKAERLKKYCPIKFKQIAQKFKVKNYVCHYFGLGFSLFCMNLMEHYWLKTLSNKSWMQLLSCLFKYGYTSHEIAEIMETAHDVSLWGKQKCCVEGSSFWRVNTESSD